MPAAIASQGISGLIATHFAPSTTSTRSLVTSATPKAVELQISTDQYSTVRYSSRILWRSFGADDMTGKSTFNMGLLISVEGLDATSTATSYRPMAAAPAKPPITTLSA